MLTRTGATLVAMAAVEAETLGWQKQGGVPQKGRARDQHKSHSSRPASFAQSCYEEDERWASGGYPSTPPWDMPDDPPRASDPKKGAATSRATAGSGDASPPESRPDKTWGWACNFCGRVGVVVANRSRRRKLCRSRPPTGVAPVAERRIGQPDLLVMVASSLEPGRWSC